MSGKTFFPLAVLPYKFAKRIGIQDDEKALRDYIGGEFAYVGLCPTGGVLVKYQPEKKDKRNFLIQHNGDICLVRGKALIVSISDEGFTTPDERTLDVFAERAYREVKL